MPTPEQLLARLDAIGAALAASGAGLALIGLGSVGVELDRLDAYSDLDFFAIVAPGQKAAFIADLGWLSAVHPIAYRFQNTADGYKLLFADGIFCEFAIFEPQELAGIPFAPGRVVWRAPGVDAAIGAPARAAAAAPPRPEWLVGEALSCLLVGMGRYRRGERLSAQRFIQHYAVDRLVELVALTTAPAAGHADPFAAERRVEQRFPALAAQLPQLVAGYSASPAAALAILAAIEQLAPVEPAIAGRIRALCAAG